MKSLQKSRVVSLVFLVSFALVALGCKETKKAPAGLHGVFTFIKGSVLVNGQQAKLGGQVGEQDLVVTGKRSAAVVQFSSGALVSLRSKSEVEVAKLSKGKDGRKEITLTQKKGSTFNKIISSENVEYSVNAPTLTAGVRGTSFSVNVERNGGSEIQLLKGKVAVKGSDSKKELLLEKGRKIKSTKTYGVSEPQKLTKSDGKQLEVMNEVALLSVQETEKLSKEASEGNVSEETAKEITAKVVSNQVASKELSKELKELTLGDLKKEYGNISKIITKSGKIYVGNFLQKGRGIQIRTTDGQFTIPANQIKKVSPY